MEGEDFGIPHGDERSLTWIWTFTGVWEMGRRDMRLLIL